MQDFFAKYGSVKEVKIITYRGGICKGWVQTLKALESKVYIIFMLCDICFCIFLK